MGTPSIDGLLNCLSPGPFVVFNDHNENDKMLGNRANLTSSQVHRNCRDNPFAGRSDIRVEYIVHHDTKTCPSHKTMGQM